MTDEKRKELAGLLSKVVDGQAGDIEMAQLDRLLSGDLKAQAYYVRYIAVHSELEKGSPLPPSQPVFPQVTTALAWSKLGTFQAFMFLLAIGLGLFLFYRPTNTVPPGGTTSSQGFAALPSEKVLTVVGSADGAEWDLTGLAPTTGAQLGAGKIHLSKGRIRLDFQAGEKVTFEAPAILEILAANQMAILQGKMVASVPQEGSGFTVILPNGAVVDLGTEFAIDVEPTGENRVKVLKGKVIASSTNSFGSTSWEEALNKGDEVSIEKDAPLKKQASDHQYIQPLESTIAPLQVSENYTQAILDSNPLGYWKFDQADSNGLVKNETEGIPLKLGIGATIKSIGDPRSPNDVNQGQLLLNLNSQQGFAQSTDSFSGLTSTNGCSLEFWIYSDSTDWQALASLALDGPVPKGPYEYLEHKPTIFAIERSGRAGSKRAHIHPDFAMRAVFRIPSGYDGGVNVYSANSYLIHSWHHIVAVKTLEMFQIYVDGQLSAESQSKTATDLKKYFLLIGRMHPLDNDIDTRQWSGAVDETSLYDRALTPDEVWQHFQANDLRN